jgi:hypothetical protein
MPSPPHPPGSDGPGCDGPDEEFAPGRRALLLASLGLAAGAAPLPVPRSNVIAFRMIRSGSEIGRHTVTFERAEEALVVHITVDALVTLISIPVVRYSHRGSETWHGDTLVALQAETNKNGDHESMSARRTDEGLVVTGTKAPRYVAPEGARPTSYWDKQMLGGPMISLEDGKLLLPKVENLGQQEIKIAAGTMIKATHFNISKAFDVDLWYDLSDAWAGMAVHVADGSEVRYERL